MLGVERSGYCEACSVVDTSSGHTIAIGNFLISWVEIRLITRISGLRARLPLLLMIVQLSNVTFATRAGRSSFAGQRTFAEH
jgi:hypothetical protein